MLALLVALFGAQRPTQKIFSDRYELIERECSYVFVVEAAHVRSEPIKLDDKSDGSTNSFSMLKESGFTFSVAKYYVTDKELDQNGRFYGFSVEEILTTPEGRTWFPKGIVDDPDGIVWISDDYVVPH